MTKLASRSRPRVCATDSASRCCRFRATHVGARQRDWPSSDLGILGTKSPTCRLKSVLGRPTARHRLAGVGEGPVPMTGLPSGSIAPTDRSNNRTRCPFESYADDAAHAPRSGGDMAADVLPVDQILDADGFRRVGA